VGQELGVEGSLPPTVTGDGIEPVLAHEDDRGRARHQLVLLEGAPGGGFAAVWRDTRHGGEVLTLARVDGEGELREPEKPLAARGAPDLGLGPSLDVGDGGQGVLVWSPPAWPGMRVRHFRPDGSFQAPPQPLDVPRSWLKAKKGALAGVRSVRSDDDGVGDPLVFASTVVDDEGDAHVAWNFAGLLFLQEVRLDGSLGELRRIDPGGPEAIGVPLLAPGAGGPELCVWNTELGLRLQRITGHTPPPVRKAGPGRALKLLPQGGESRQDAGAEGWWVLVEHEDHLALRTLTGSGDRTVADLRVVEGPHGHSDVARWSEGIVVLSQPGAGGGRGEDTGSPFEILFLSADGRETVREPIRPLSADSAGGLTRPMSTRGSSGQGWRSRDPCAGSTATSSAPRRRAPTWRAPGETGPYWSGRTSAPVAAPCACA
jgi:hypothetical protein